MTTKEVYEARTNYIRGRCDYILDAFHESFMSEFVVKCGGDCITYRVYGTDASNFRITER